MTTKKRTKKSDALPSPFLKLSSNARNDTAYAALPWVSVLQPAYCNMHSTAQETPALASLPQWANGTHSLVPTSYNQYLQRGKRFSQLVADINDKLVILANHNLLTASAILARAWGLMAYKQGCVVSQGKEQLKKASSGRSRVCCSLTTGMYRQNVQIKYFLGCYC